MQPLLTEEFIGEILQTLTPHFLKLLPFFILAIIIKTLIRRIPHGRNKKSKTNSKVKGDKEKENNKIKGDEFEEHVGKLLQKDGWLVTYNGKDKGKEDGGVDLIAKKEGTTVLIQCKYRSNPKWIHNENEINELCGALEKYRYENPNEKSKAAFITTGQYSPVAKKTANIHGIELINGGTVNLNFEPSV